MSQDHIRVFIDDPDMAKELETIRHIERTLKPLQERVSKFRAAIDAKASEAASGTPVGTVVTFEIGGPQNVVTAVCQARSGFDRKRMLADYPDFKEAYGTSTACTAPSG